MKLTIRKNGSYYQLGYYTQGRWVNVEHLGTPKQILELVRTAKCVAYQSQPRTKEIVDLHQFVYKE